MKKRIAMIMLALLLIPMAGCGSAAPVQSLEEATSGSVIRISDGEHTVTFQLNDSTAAKALAAQLPLSLEVSDYGDNEKIFYPPEALDVSGAPMAEGGIGTLAYYAPWADVVLFFGSYSPHSGLYALGQAVSGVEAIHLLKGTITVETLPESAAGEADAKILVAYFSNTGNTAALAEYAADILGADLHEIRAKIPYTSEDLKYNDSSSRATREQNDASVRPVIAGQVEDMARYHTVILAYPIWWGQAPKIISTFLESYDFSGKTIVPFCTSGSSGIGSSDSNLHGLTSDNTVWKGGRRFAVGTSKEVLAEWLHGQNP